MSSLEEVFPNFLKKDLDKRKEEVRNIILREREIKNNISNNTDIIPNTAVIIPNTAVIIPNTADKCIDEENGCNSTANHFFNCKDCRKRIMYYNSVLESVIYVLSIIILIMILGIVNKN